MGVEMGKEKLKKTLLTSLFKRITRAEREDALQKEIEDINENAKQKTPMPNKVEKCLVRHPKKLVTTLQFEKKIKHEEGEEEVANKRDGSKTKTLKIKKPIHKLVSTTFMATHNSYNSKIWHKF